MWLKPHRLGQLGFKHRHVHNPGQAGHLELSGAEVHLATIVAFDLHRQDFGRVLGIGPASQRFKQGAGFGIQGIGPHVAGVRRYAPDRRWDWRHQANAKTLARQQQGQRATHNAAAADANIKGLSHVRDCRRQGKIRSTLLSGDHSVNASTFPAGDVSALIARLFVYPVKSCAGIEVQEAVLTQTGLDLDRAWMVVDANGEFVTQRERRRLALVRPQLKTHELVLRAPGMLSLHIAVDAVEQPTTVKVWDDVVPAYDMGGVAAQWFTDFLSLSDDGTPATNAPPYRLVRFDPEHRRVSNLQWTGGVEALNQFSDGYPLLVMGEASLASLNDRLRAAGQGTVGMERFRPNVVLSGLQAHDEDRLDLMRIDAGTAQVLLKPVKPCPRCPIPNIDPVTAVSTPVVGDTLQTYRQDARVGGAVTFGMNVIVMDGL